MASKHKAAIYADLKRVSMNNTKEMYQFMAETWQYIKNTTAPNQSDQAAWDAIVDKSNELCREFNRMMAKWMVYLRNESRTH